MSQATLQHHAPPSPGERSDAPRVAVPFAAIVLAMLPAVLDQTILATALPVIAGDLGSLTDVSWVVTAYVVAAAATDAAVGQARRPPRAQAACSRSRSPSSSLASALCGAAQDITQLIVLRARPGRRRGRPDDAGDGRGRRPRRAARARALPGLHRRHLRRRDDRRSAARRRARRARELALGLLRQPADRRRRAGRAAPAPAGAGGRAAPNARSTSAAPRCSRARRAPCMLACIWGGQRYAWDSAEIVALLAATVGLSGGAARRASGARADPIVPFHLLRTRRRGHRERRAVPRHGRAVRGHRVRPAVPGDDDGREPDAGRAAARAGDARDHRLDDALGPQHRAHRALQALPDRRPGAA